MHRRLLLVALLAACGRLHFDPLDDAGGGGVEISGTLDAYIKASTVDLVDLFGVEIALSADGNTLAVGTPFEDSASTGINGDQVNNGAMQSGAVFVFVRTGSTWTQQAYVKASNTELNDYFGRFVALSANGDTLAVGSTGEASNATGINGDDGDNSFGSSGAVYVFTRAGSTWSQQAYVKASNTGISDEFSIVALSDDGNTLAVGAAQESSTATGIDGDGLDNNALISGAAYVFTRTGVTWSQQAYIKASNTDVGDAFGRSLALSGDGNTLAVGAGSESSAATGIGGDQSSNAVANSGAVYVFSRTGATWSQQEYIKASTTGVDELFGYDLALSRDGNTLVASSSWEDSGARGVGGDDTDNSALDSGAVYIFSRTGVSWMQDAYVKASNTDPSDHFGLYVALSSDANCLAVGTLFEEGGSRGFGGDQTTNDAPASGAVYLFTRGSSWTQYGYLKASNAEANDAFGGVALSADGSVLATSAADEDGGSPGIGGDQSDNSVMDSGAVYVWR